MQYLASKHRGSVLPVWADCPQPECAQVGASGWGQITNYPRSIVRAKPCPPHYGIPTTGPSTLWLLSPHWMDECPHERDHWGWNTWFGHSVSSHITLCMYFWKQDSRLKNVVFFGNGEYSFPKSSTWSSTKSYIVVLYKSAIFKKHEVLRKKA